MITVEITHGRAGWCGQGKGDAESRDLQILQKERSGERERKRKRINKRERRPKTSFRRKKSRYEREEY